MAKCANPSCTNEAKVKYCSIRCANLVRAANPVSKKHPWARPAVRP